MSSVTPAPAGTKEATARPTAGTAERRDLGLDAVFRPRSVAVIGASRERGTIGAEIFHNLLAHGFQGPVYPVNPNAAVVQSVTAYPSIAAVPGPVDLAVIVVPAAHALEVLEACGRQGVRAAVVISAGFKEAGPEGRERELALAECARRHGMRLVGPNCLGVLNTEPGVRLDATFAPTFPPAGRVAFSSQSGALGLAILEVAAQLHIGISHFISVGNKADVSGNDLLEFWEHDPGTNVILLYLESFGNPRRFTQIARRVARRKPIVAVKSGRTAAGARAASSHTGSLAGTDVAVDALCAQSGVIRTDTIAELFDVAMLLSHQPVPRGDRVAIVTNAGGPGIMASDACESHGLRVVTLEPATVAALRTFLPPEASTRNPVDMIASAKPESFEKAVRLVLGDPQVDSLLAIYVPPVVTRPLDVAQAIVRGAALGAEDAAARGLPVKPVLSCFMGTHGVPEGLRSLQRGNIPSYAFPESAAIALSRAVRYGTWLEEPEGRRVRFPDADAARAARAVAAGRARATQTAPVWLRPDEVAEVLGAYGLGLTAMERAASADEAVAAARRIGFPVALKLASDTVTHKSEVGGVALDLRRDDEIREAWTRIEQRLRDLVPKHPPMAGTVQRMVRDGIEAIVGVTHDPSFGPLIMFGLGGVQVELLRDVAFRIHPVTDRDAHEMVRAVRGFRLLEGYRGAPPGDIAALEQIVLRVSQIIDDHPDIVEMDLNPIKVLSPGHGCIVVDARIAVAPDPDPFHRDALPLENDMNRDLEVTWPEPVREVLLARARRVAPSPPPGGVVADLVHGLSDAEVAERRGLPLAAVAGVRSFYDLIDAVPRVCDGTACHFEGAEPLEQRLAQAGPIRSVRCLGHCYAAPAFQSGEEVFARPRDESVSSWLDDWGEGASPAPDLEPVPRRALAEVPVVLRNLVNGARAGLAVEYDLPDGDRILGALEAAHLRGRGGAAYPTADKWRTARDTPAAERFVVANGDEGDPGSFVDRLLLEEDPHAALAGMLACARVIGARRGIVYVRAEYPRARSRVEAAIVHARAAGYLGASFDVEVVSGAGAYVCGEETALLRSIAGLRGEPRPKPPYPAQSGLFGMPTVVQNVETLAAVPWVARHARPTGTKAVSLSGAVARPGVVEIPLGMPLRRVLEQGGGGRPDGRSWRMALIGGPMGCVLPERLFDTPLSYEALPALGHAGIVVLDERVTPRALAEHLFAFARAESCGSCTPCRVGTARLAQVRDAPALRRLLETMEIGSLCGFGQGVPRPLRDLLEHFGDEALA